jgi:pantoate--beta-alanine ligase
MTRCVQTLDELRAFLVDAPHPIGLVPTMGYLHEGHLSLVRRARAECATVGISIFVNPTQFAPTEDLLRYPRNLPRDLSLLEPLRPDVIWAPSPEEVYPAGYQTYVDVEQISKPLEGAARPSMFRGVSTVVAKLFIAFTPQSAYFGQKDAQQVAVLRRMARDFNFPVEIVVCPILREVDGLAMSSRNSYLSAEERRAAAVLYRSLSAAQTAFENGECSAERLRRRMSQTLAAEPLARAEYVSVADAESLAELDRIEGDALLSMAVRIGKTRLIDNFQWKAGVWEMGVFL